VDTSRPLNWKAGGGTQNPTYPYDYAKAPNLTLISDAIHSTTNGNGRLGSGIVFGAVGNDVRWSAVGYPWAWPAVNTWPSADPVRFITTDVAQTLVFTGSTVYAATGVDDTNVNFNRLAVDSGLRIGANKTVARSPYGVVYLAQRGMNIIQSQAATPLCLDTLSPDFWNGLSAIADPNGVVKFVGAYYGRHYFLGYGSGTLVFDFTHWPRVSVTNTDIICTAMHNTPFETASRGPGLYIAEKNDRNGSNNPQIRAWMPDQASTQPNGLPGRGSRASWTWKTGRINAGLPGKDKLFETLKFDKSGACTVKVYTTAC
jgi:hypothetical protein